MFNRFESFKQAIIDKSIDANTLMIMIDFHQVKGTLSEEETAELFTMLAPPTEPTETEALEP
jgi:hypothetical protein